MQETKGDIKKRQCHSQNNNELLPKLENTRSSVTPTKVVPSQQGVHRPLFVQFVVLGVSTGQRQGIKIT